MRAGSMSPQIISDTASTVCDERISYGKNRVSTKRSSLTCEVWFGNDMHYSRLEVASEACTAKFERSQFAIEFDSRIPFSFEETHNTPITAQTKAPTQ